MAASPDDFPSGTAIYLNDGETPELIAIVKDIDPSTLDLHNPEQFQGSTSIPEISVTAVPDTPLTEAEGNTGSFNFQLSEPTPAGGLTIYFRAGDDDPFPQSRDVNFNPEANTNIEDISVIPLDYALITDFESDLDAIALAGEKSNYSLDASPEGTGIYVNDGSSPELIAIVAGIEPDSLSLNNSSQFIFK